MSTDDLPTEVLTELGRVTWAAIELEGYAEGLCFAVEPTNPRTDTRLVSRRIADAQVVLGGWPASPARRDAEAWLDRAQRAIQRRYAAVHATSLVWVEPGQAVGPARLRVGEEPRKGRPYVERPFTVESLSQLRSELVEATRGWRSIVLAVSSERTRLRKGTYRKTASTDRVGEGGAGPGRRG